ncbi:MAG TPA: helix-turn-helix domain-containing protein [Ktedonobacteraceae bacterium]
MAYRARKSQDVVDMPEKASDMSQSDTTGELLTVHEVARHLRVDDTTVRRWIKSGALEAITLPHRGKRRGYRVRKVTIDELFNSSSMPI